MIISQGPYFHLPYPNIQSHIDTYTLLVESILEGKTKKKNLSIKSIGSSKYANWSCISFYSTIHNPHLLTFPTPHDTSHLNKNLIKNSILDFYTQFHYSPCTILIYTQFLGQGNYK